MTREEVRQKMESFLQFMREEQEIRDQLASLQFTAESEQEIEKAMSEQSRLIEQLETLRQEKMLPLLNEVAEFVAQKKSELNL